MIQYPKTPAGMAIFCDDIRHEMFGKTSLIGIYNNELALMAPAPAIIPILACQLTFIFEEWNMPREVIFRIMAHTEHHPPELVSEAAVDLEGQELPQYQGGFGENKQVYQIVLAARISPLRVPSDMTLRAGAHVGDDEYRLGSLNIKLADPELAGDHNFLG